MKTRRAVDIVIGVVVVGVVLGSAALGGILWRIDESVRAYCLVAQLAHPHSGDDVAALSDFINSDSHSFRDRNLAVWTLGRLRDPNALPALERLYTGDRCEHAKNLCQYELEKAIKRCGGFRKPPQKAMH